MDIEVFNKEGVKSLLMINIDETPIYFDMQEDQRTIGEVIDLCL